MTRRPGRRVWAAVLTLAVVMTALVALRPSATTMAAWSDEVVVEIPPLRTGGLDMAVAGDGTTSATIDVTGELPAQWAPTTVTVALDGRALSGQELAGSRVEYRIATDQGCRAADAPVFVATPGGTGSSLQVTGEETLTGQRTLCVTFVPSDAVLVQIGSGQVTLTTQLASHTEGPSTWTAAGQWEAAQPLQAPDVTALTCANEGWGVFVLLSWEWERGDLTGDIRDWVVQRQDGSGWRNVATVRGDETTRRAFPVELGHDAEHTLRVVARLADGGTHLASPETKVDVRTHYIGWLPVRTVWCS